jgi:hypothetical protein
MDGTVVLKTDVNMIVQFKEVTMKSLQQNEGHLCVVPDCTNLSSEGLYAFLASLLIAI